jgi:hypothetical protein
MTTQSPRQSPGFTFPLRRVIGEREVPREHRNAEGDLVRTVMVTVDLLECGHETEPPERNIGRAKMRKCTKCGAKPMKAER